MSAVTETAEEATVSVSVESRRGAGLASDRGVRARSGRSVRICGRIDLVVPSSRKRAQAGHTVRDDLVLDVLERRGRWSIAGSQLASRKGSKSVAPRRGHDRLGPSPPQECQPSDRGCDGGEEPC